ncbi:MAG: HAD family hydrolase [Candidatus Hodarchaeota archaeon]
MGSTTKFKALILDCDGVIVDSEPLSCGAWNVLFQREYKLDIGTNYEAILGGNTRDAARYYLKKHDLEITDEIIEKLCALKEKTYLELAKDKLKPINGVERIFEQAKQLGWKIGVASSGIPSKIKYSLTQVGFQNRFDAITGMREGLRGKPFPDIFLETAIKLTTDPKECVVIEDTPKGIMAAKRASMLVIGITSTFPKEILNNADLIISSFQELDLRRI